MGDLHDPASNATEVYVPLKTFLYNETKDVQGHCLYSISLYTSSLNSSRVNETGTSSRVNETKTSSRVNESEISSWLSESGTRASVPVLGSLIVLFSFLLVIIP